MSPHRNPVNYKIAALFSALLIPPCIPPATAYEAAALQSEMLASEDNYIAIIKKAYPGWTGSFLKGKDGLVFGLIYKKDTREAILIFDYLPGGERTENIKMTAGGQDVSNGLKPEIIPLYLKKTADETTIAARGIGVRFKFNYDPAELKIRIDGQTNAGIHYTASAYADPIENNWIVETQTTLQASAK